MLNSLFSSQIDSLYKVRYVYIKMFYSRFPFRSRSFKILVCVLRNNLKNINKLYTLFIFHDNNSQFYLPLK